MLWFGFVLLLCESTVLEVLDEICENRACLNGMDFHANKGNRSCRMTVSTRENEFRILKKVKL